MTVVLSTPANLVLSRTVGRASVRNVQLRAAGARRPAVRELTRIGAPAVRPKALVGLTNAGNIALGP